MLHQVLILQARGMFSVDCYTVPRMNGHVSDLRYVCHSFYPPILRANVNCFVTDRLIKVSNDIPLQYASSIAGSPVAALRMIREFQTLQEVNYKTVTFQIFP